MRLRAIACVVVLAATLDMNGGGGIATEPIGWRVADQRLALQFPEDHAAHTEYGLEWWYYTGALASGDGRQFGFQLTFFRVGIDPAPRNPSRWAVRDIYIAHAAVTDVAAGRHLFAERINRAGVGWAGASVDEFRVWNEDWEARLERDGTHTLIADTGQFGLHLELRSPRPPVLHGDAGFSRKGAGSASHYYSMPRMETRGEIVVDGVPMQVAGTTWMDHEFGTSFLGADQEGWDWLSLNFDDGSSLMVFRIRASGGATPGYSGGTYVAPDGRAVALQDSSMEPVEDWTTPDGTTTYPVRWRVTVPSVQLDLEVWAVVPDQEVRARATVGFSYWEGLVHSSGESGVTPVTGVGYLELTGYAGQPMGTVFGL